MRLGYRVDEQLPAEVTSVVDAEVVVVQQPLTIRVPDVVVTHTATYQRNPARIAATDVLLAVEILSDGTRRVDRVMKLSEYAEAGIPRYWIVDLDEPATLPVVLRGDAVPDADAGPDRPLFRGTVAQWAEDAERVAELGVGHLVLQVAAPVQAALDALHALRAKVGA